MFNFIIGLVEITALITVVVAVYMAFELIRELREMRDDAEADRYRKGDWP